MPSILPQNNVNKCKARQSQTVYDTVQKGQSAFSKRYQKFCRVWKNARRLATLFMRAVMLVMPSRVTKGPSSWLWLLRSNVAYVHGCWCQIVFKTWGRNTKLAVACLLLMTASHCWDSAQNWNICCRSDSEVSCLTTSYCVLLLFTICVYFFFV